MKKILLLMIALTLFSGCSIKKIEIDKTKIIDTILKENNYLTNTVSPGYKYYIPKEVVLVGRNSHNEILYSKGAYYYLYVDMVSYSNKVESEYIENKDAYYSKKLDYNNNKGYIEITKLKDKYFIEMMYNYAKIEAYVGNSNIEDVIIDSSYILSSLKFNKIIAETTLEKNEESKNEEKLNIFIPKRKGTFLDFSSDEEEQEETDLEDLGKEE